MMAYGDRGSRTCGLSSVVWSMPSGAEVKHPASCRCWSRATVQPAGLSLAGGRGRRVAPILLLSGWP